MRVHTYEVLLISAMIWAGVCSYVYSRILEQVNRSLPDDEKLETWYEYPSKPIRIIRLHRNFYPQSRLRLLTAALGVGILAFFIALVVTSRWQS